MTVLTLLTVPAIEPDPVPCPGWCVRHDHDRESGADFHESEEMEIRSGNIGPDVNIGLTRVDEPGAAGDVAVALGVGRACYSDLTPAAAYAVASALIAHALSAAEDTGIEIDVCEVQVGWQILGPDGWETVTGTMSFANPPMVSVFTEEHNDGDTDGLQFNPDHAVRVREVPS
jgi:hypothetical protein